MVVSEPVNGAEKNLIKNRKIYDNDKTNNVKSRLFS